MDTKSKDNKRRVNWALLPVVLITVLAAGATAALGPLYGYIMRDTPSYYDQSGFVRTLCRGSVAQYWRLLQRQYDGGMSPAEVFFPGVVEEQRELALRADSDWQQDRLQLLDDIVWACDHAVEDWKEQFDSEWGRLEYLVLYRDVIQYGYSGNDLKALAYGDRDTELLARLREDYTYYVALAFGKDGTPRIDALHGASAEALEAQLTEADYARFWRDTLGDYGVNMADTVFAEAATPQGISVVYAIPRQVDGYSYLAGRAAAYDQRALLDGGLWALYFGLVGIAAALGLCMSLLMKRELPPLVARMPLEFAVALGVLSCVFGEPLGLLAKRMWEPATTGLEIAGRSALPVLAGCTAFLVFWGTMMAAFIAVYSVFRIFRVGPRRYFGERCLTGLCIVWTVRGARRLYRWVADIDLTDAGDKTVLKIVAANFLVLAAMCLLWFFGIIGLLVYSAVLFAVLRGYVRDLKRQYGVLLQAAGEMALGRLDAPIDGDLGVFEPLGQQMRAVQQGFRRAVDAEVRSRSMKTELVANVSHDLKTPLTAIITYVDLLKNEDITPEERRSYIATLDMKSQRLGRLIEDLFEMSKATSGNITMELQPVDLPSLIRQVELELSEEIESSGVEFRSRIPDERVSVMLDGEKAFRIFENLMVNIIKYAMPGTRAYIDLILRGERVVVKISNISREPLEDGVDDLTERFVRGDRSRGTEGSGLGLAIARSFTELQGGKLIVSADSDLFKVVVAFPVCAAQPDAVPPQAPDLPEIPDAPEILEIPDPFAFPDTPEFPVLPELPDPPEPPELT